MKPLIIYIIGDNRSGSTLLEYLLSFHPDAITLGEMHHIHDYYFKKKRIGAQLRNWECSCGNQIDDCLFWNNILKKTFFSESFITKLNFKESIFSLTYLFTNKNKTDHVFKNEAASQKGKVVAQNCWKVYNTVADTTKKSIIIDASKNAYQAYSLAKYNSNNIRFILLERDFWAVAYSKLNWAKKREIYSQKVNTIYYYILSSFIILKRNRILSKKIQCSSSKSIVKTVHYSHLAINPQGTIEEICSFLNIDKFHVPNKTNSKDNLDHVLQGSPARNEKKNIEIDNKWEKYFKTNSLAYAFVKILKRFV